MKSWTASAKAISLPRNHRDTTVVAATMKSSLPTPSTKRPAAMARAGLAGRTAGRTATSAAPAAPIAPKSSEAGAVPSRSMSTPPARRVRNAATL